MQPYIKKSKLSSPIYYSGESVEEMLANGLDYFYNIFLKKEVKPKIKGYNIFFDMNQMYNRIFNMPYPLSFMHITSLDNDDKYTLFPCVNDYSNEICENMCDLGLALYPYQTYGRWECLYRLSRIHWIPEVIALANLEDEDIQIFAEEKTDGRKKYLEYNIRYKCGMDDYLIILRERRDRGDFLFITAFPVVTKSKKIQVDQNAKNKKASFR